MTNLLQEAYNALYPFRSIATRAYTPVDQVIDKLRIAISSQSKTTAVVPLQPTAEMIAAAEQVEDLYRRGTPNTWVAVYRAMVSSAPNEAGND